MMKKVFVTVLLFLMATGLCVGGIVLGHLPFSDLRRKEDRYDGSIEIYYSQNDQDGDGIDDQNDILQSALEYLKTRPHYRSAYYESGYPDDGFGVCTDVVAFGLLGAGYDLSQLVDEDILSHPSDYDVPQRDRNIDFRRVRNLQVCFRHTAEELTRDPLDIREWQGGDIVIFPGHIGIVSERRNAQGIPYVLHHYSSFQWSYEEDILLDREIIGHFRIK